MHMAKPVSNSLLTLMLLVSALVVGLILVQSRTSYESEAKQGPDEVSYQLASGYNAIAIPFDLGLTASGVCDQLQGNGISVLSWNEPSQTFRFYACTGTGDDFSIAAYEGLMVNVSAATTWQVSGEPAQYGLEPIKGVNFMSFRPGPQAAKASDICKDYANFKGQLTADYLERYAEGETWERYSCVDGSGIDFEVAQSTGYMLSMAER